MADILKVIQDVLKLDAQAKREERKIMREVQKKLKEKDSEEVTEKSGDKEEYQQFVTTMLKKFGVKSPAELAPDKKKEFYDDYAHHPTEIKSVIDSARQVYKKRKIVCVFQPHRYSRVRRLKKEFASSFKYSDAVVLCPVYAAGEKSKYNYNQNKFSKMDHS